MFIENLSGLVGVILDFIVKRQFMQLVLSLFLLFVNASFSWAERLPVWEVHAGLVGVQSPHYRGSNSYNTVVLPFPALTYRGERLKVSDGKLQGLLYTSKRVELDFSLAASLPASPDDNSARKGMLQLDSTFEVGPSLITHLWRSESKNTSLSLEFPVRAAFSVDTDNLAIRGHGWMFAPFVDIKHYYDRWKLSFSLGPIFATRRYHDYFYGVSAQYATSVRPAYDADRGYSGSRVTLSVDKHFNRLLVVAFARYDTLSNATFMESPLIERSNNLSAGFVIMWQIAKSKRLTDYSH